MRAGDARALGEVLVLDDVERRDPDRRRERIPPERAPVVARLERRHDVPRREDRRDRIDAAAERFPEDEDVGLCILVLISEAHSGPPKPGMNNTFRSRQSVRAVVRYPSGGTMIPPSPWIGSTKKAQVFGVIAFSSAAGSPYGTMRNPGANGPKSLRYRSTGENPMIVVVRPWKFPSQTMISA